MGMELIEHVEIGSGGAASITFASIAANYTDLKILISARNTNGIPSYYSVIKFNGSAASFTERSLGGNGSSAYSFTTPGNFSGEMNGSTSTSNTFNNGEIYIPNYAGSTKKSFSANSVSENNATTTQLSLTAGLWSNTDAITSITLEFDGAYTYVQYSTASLYGIS
jgi:hypothetical protein